MIIKSFELQKIKSSNSSIILIYGNNEGLKEQIINDCFIKDFKGEINKTLIGIINILEIFHELQTAWSLGQIRPYQHDEPDLL